MADSSAPAAKMATGEIPRCLDVRTRTRLRCRRYRTRAAASGDGIHIIGGQKMWLTNGDSSTRWWPVLCGHLTRRVPTKLAPQPDRLPGRKPTGFGEVAPGLTIPESSTSLAGDRHHRTGSSTATLSQAPTPVLGGKPGQGFSR